MEQCSSAASIPHLVLFAPGLCRSSLIITLPVDRIFIITSHRSSSSPRVDVGTAQIAQVSAVEWQNGARPSAWLCRQADQDPQGA